MGMRSVVRRRRRPGAPDDGPGTGQPDAVHVEGPLPNLNQSTPVVIRSKPDVRPTSGAPLDGSIACRAPFSSMHLDQFGNARACCQSDLLLGNVADHSLLEIWNGEPLARQRAAIADADFSVGCGYCEWSVRNDGPELAYARNFDHLEVPVEGDGPTMLEMALSNACNLQCTMCNGDYSSAIRSHREHREPLPSVYDEQFFEDLRSLIPGLRDVHLLGGEPFLGQEPLRVMDLIAEHGPNAQLVITTNGTVWTKRVEKLTEALNASYVISIDGASASTYESIRVGANWHGLLANLPRFKRAGHDLYFAHCLMVDNWFEFPDFLALAARFDAAVFINTVLSPLDSSLHHLAPLPLAHVIRSLEAREAEVLALGDPWAASWSKEMDRLRDTLADAAGGNVHTHLLGGHRPSSEAGDDELVHQSPPLTEDPDDRVLIVEVGRNMRVTAIEAVADGDGLPPLDVDAMIGLPYRLVDRALGHGTVDEISRITYQRSETIVDEESLLQVGSDLMTERRIVRDDGNDWFNVTVAHRRVLAESSLAHSVAAEGAPGLPVVVMDIDVDHRITSIDPSPDAASTVGVIAEIGAFCQTPIDVLRDDLRHDDLTMTVDPLDWVTNRVRVQTPDGLDLRIASRMRFAQQSLEGVRVYLTAKGLPG